jgi:tRNA dimethylallyltransferase
MSIGTAKPSLGEMDGIVHHFIDSHSVEETYTAGKFETDALLCISDIHKRGKTPIMLGGSGLYIKAVLEGLDDLPSSSELRETLNREFEQKGLPHLQEKLKVLDPAYFEEIDQQNPIRIIRAIELITLTGKRMAALHSKKNKDRDFQPIIIGLNKDREKLYADIDKRVDIMINSGLVEEVKKLQNYKNHQALQSVGYRELNEYFEGKIDLNRAVDLIKRNSRRYAKRQITWINTIPDLQWFEPDKQTEILDHIRSRMIEIQS